jgi:protease-4
MTRPPASPRSAVALALTLAGLLSVPRSSTADERPSVMPSASAAAVKPVLVDLTLKGDLSEDPAPVGFDGQPVTENLKGLLDTLAKARDDGNVKGLVLRIRDVSLGWGKSHELRQALKDFRSSGKKAVAVLEMAGNADYLVATAADEIVMPESGWLMLKGLAAEVTFYKKLFDKLGVTAETIQVGEYKGAGEPYSRTEMSPAFREELTAVLNDRYALMVEAIAARQGITAEDARRLLDGGPYTPDAARKVGLVNRVAYADQIESEVAKGLGLKDFKLETRYGKKPREAVDVSGIAGLMKMMQMLSGESARKAPSKGPKVALIYASGMIQTGRSTPASLLGGAVLGSDTVVKHLRQAADDPTVKAIVLRVDSPGGSALASDLIWRQVSRVGKPIVASLSDVAASGGYYISMGCDKIFAEPGTLTGSIGVISVKLAMGGLLDKVGVTTDTVTVGRNARFDSVVAPWGDSERAAMRRLSQEVYRQFVGKAAKGRKMPFSDLEKKAGGRVYTGRQAKKEGLVDELGTLSDAIAEAKSLAGLGRDEAAELLVLPKPQSVLESLVAPLEDRDRDASAALAASALGAALPEALREPLARVGGLVRLLAAEPVVLLAPFELRIR